MVPPPATTILNAPQYLTGKVLGDDAAAYYRGTRLGGKADVVLLTQDSLQFLAPRFVAMRDALQGHARRRLSSPTFRRNPVNEDGGYATMKTDPPGASATSMWCSAPIRWCSARCAALREAGKDRPDQYPRRDRRRAGGGGGDQAGQRAVQGEHCA